ncbi:hypothetical protein UT300005_04600 [Clostridium sp. CTA-5]
MIYKKGNKYKRKDYEFYTFKNDESRIANIEFEDNVFKVELEGHSFNTIVLK